MFTLTQITNKLLSTDMVDIEFRYKTIIRRITGYKKCRMRLFFSLNNHRYLREMIEGRASSRTLNHPSLHFSCVITRYRIMFVIIDTMIHARQI